MIFQFKINKFKSIELYRIELAIKCPSIHHNNHKNYTATCRVYYSLYYTREARPDSNTQSIDNTSIGLKSIFVLMYILICFFLF